MATFYSEDPRRLLVSEPQLTRWRSRHRGHRESYKMNLEAAQTYFDIVRLYERSAAVKEDLANKMTYLTDGADVAGVSWRAEDEIFFTEVSVTGSNSLIARVQKLENRVLTLERNREI